MKNNFHPEEPLILKFVFIYLCVRVCVMVLDCSAKGRRIRGKFAFFFPVLQKEKKKKEEKRLYIN